MSVKSYLTLECMAEVPGCSSERCQCYCHGETRTARRGLQHTTPGGHVTTFRIDMQGVWPAPDQAGLHEQWLIAEWARQLTEAGGRPLGIPSVWADLVVLGITNEISLGAIDWAMDTHGIRPGEYALWHAEGSAERMPDDARQQ